MCGIYGAFLHPQINEKDGKRKSTSQKKTPPARRDATQLVFEGIKRIEYRGYDSWGVASLLSDNKNPFSIFKKIGKISDVKKLDQAQSRLAVGHTRWATHGGVTQKNAHPHQSQTGEFVVVHNGVIENFQELKAELKKKKYKFKSETDTEVVVGLLDLEIAAGQKVDLATVRKVLSRLAGRSTIVILTKRGQVFAYRYGSPLVVGKDKLGSVFVASDMASISVDASQAYNVEHGQLVSISPELEVMITTLDKNAKLEPIKLSKIDIKQMEMNKAGYKHFMLKEIYEQARVLENTLADDKNLEKVVQKIKQARRVYLVGAGSANFVSMYAAHHLRMVGVDALAIKSYEARAYKTIWSKKDLLVAISQSGETADTNEVVEWAKEDGLTIASIVNMPGSTLTSMSDVSCMLNVGTEVGVASTKAMIGQMTWCRSLSYLVSGKKLTSYVSNVQKFQNQLMAWFEDKKFGAELVRTVGYLKKRDHMFVLGRGELYPAALEFSLKMKEISYLHTEGFSGGELKHGVIALIEKGTPVICLIADDIEKTDMLSAAAEVRARGAYVIGVSAENNDLFDQHLAIPKTDLFAAQMSCIPSHLLCYKLALELGFDPDKPRNLAKSVTVK